jgi:hypothetical protein
MNAGDKININGKIYKAHSFNVEVNNKRTNCSSPCMLCDLEPVHISTCADIDCVNGTEFLYLKKI